MIKRDKKGYSNMNSFNTSTMNTFSTYSNENKTIPNVNIKLFTSESKKSKQDIGIKKATPTTLHNSKQEPLKLRVNNRKEEIEVHLAKTRITKLSENSARTNTNNTSPTKQKIRGKSADPFKTRGNSNKSEASTKLTNTAYNKAKKKKSKIEKSNNKTIEIKPKVGNIYKRNELTKTFIISNSDNKSKDNNNGKCRNWGNPQGRENNNNLLPWSQQHNAVIVQEDLISKDILQSISQFAIVLSNLHDKKQNIEMKQLKANVDTNKTIDNEREVFNIKQEKKKKSQKNKPSLNNISFNPKLDIKATGTHISKGSVKQAKLKKTTANEIIKINNNNISRNLENVDECNDKIEDTYVGIQLPQVHKYQVDKPWENNLKYKQWNSFSIFEDDDPTGNICNWSKVFIGDIDAYEDIIEKDKIDKFKSQRSKSSFGLHTTIRNKKPANIQMLEEVNQVSDWEEENEENDSDVNLFELNDDNHKIGKKIYHEGHHLVPNHISKLMFCKIFDEANAQAKE